jgi:hypothetical protein
MPFSDDAISRVLVHNPTNVSFFSCAVRNTSQIASPQLGHEFSTKRFIGIYHGSRQAAKFKQLSLRHSVFVHAAVVINMVSAKIRENSHIERHVGNSVLF